MIATTQHRLFTVDEYYKMAEAGILREDDRVELIGGEIVQMSPIGDQHADCVDQFILLFRSLLEKGIRIRIQNPLLINETSVLQPDCMLLKSKSRFYKRTPTPKDVLLVIEVADSSLAKDKNVKIPLFAQSGIPEAWLVDLTTETVSVFRNPVSGSYQDVQVLNRGKSIAPLADPNLEIEVNSIFG